jgi:hypothetical protein
MSPFRSSTQGVTFTVKVTPRAARTQIEGWRENLLKVRLHAPPVDGKANTALIALLAETLKIPKGNIEIIGGETSRQKVICVKGLSTQDIQHRLELVISNE